MAIHCKLNESTANLQTEPNEPTANQTNLIANRCKCLAPKPPVRAQRTHRAQRDYLVELYLRPGERSSVRNPVVQDYRRQGRGVLSVYARTMA